MDGTTKILQDAVYAFNSRNNITGITNTSSEYTTAYNYSYDGLNRLTAADGQYQESADNYTKTFRQSFAYAKNGNLLAKRNHNFNDNTLIDEWNYQYSNHQVTHIDSTQSGNNRLVMSYDSSGNMTYQRDNFKDLTKTITVDSQNRITQVQDALSTTIGNYWYDEGGFRVRKKALVPSGASFKNQEILYPSKFYGLEYSEETNILSSINNVYLNGVRIAALNEDGVTAYFLTDQVDSVAHVLDEGAHTLSRMQYEPYGETFVQRGTLDFAPKYNSQELDRETNFYFYNARYYDPQIARFTSADSVVDGSEDTQGWNRFAYVKGNPIRYKDPTGHCIEPVSGTMCAIGAAEVAVVGISALLTLTAVELETGIFQKSLRKVAEGVRRISEPETSQKDNPGPQKPIVFWPFPTGSNNEKNPTTQQRDHDDLARVRFQLQSGSTLRGDDRHYWSTVEENHKRIGVTKRQGFNALTKMDYQLKNKSFAPGTKFDPLPNKVLKSKEFAKAVRKMSQRIKKDVMPGYRGGPVTSWQEPFKVDNVEYRIDVENKTSDEAFRH